LTIMHRGGARTVLAIRKGGLVVPASDALGRRARGLLEALCARDDTRYNFDETAQVHPPGARCFDLAAWVRRHFESQVDHARALVIARELSSARIQVRRSQAPPASILDATDRRIVWALTERRRLDEIWALAKCPRFRLLSFVYFLRKVGAISVDASPRPVLAAHTGVERTRARMLLGVSESADHAAVKRAYRQCVRRLHPDLNSGLGAMQKRRLEERLAEVNGAYRLLNG